jgi:hypothetical protein
MTPGIAAMVVEVAPPLILCDVPGGEALLSTGAEFLRASIVAVGVFVLGVGVIQARRGGGQGSAEGRKKVLYGLGLLAVGLLFFALLSYFAADVVGTSFGDIGLGCMTG